MVHVAVMASMLAAVVAVVVAVVPVVAVCDGADATIPKPAATLFEVVALAAATAVVAGAAATLFEVVAMAAMAVVVALLTVSKASRCTHVAAAVQEAGSMPFRNSPRESR